MYLKKIITNGFKSFADKVTITLRKDQITGIVGPNGSGKSNVIDAVRWVMGEQNAKMLRGELATDIIFAGSQTRKSQGMAEVSLVFDNGESSPFCPPEYRHEAEIVLTRRIYMDGEREYFINRQPCRLKDITHFFASTGLGGRSYSMIQQGQVDRILQAKPEQLREILEEAAGTLVFKKKHQETQKKIEETQLNLSRVGDILLEVDRQLASLDEQVTKAREFKELSQTLRDSEFYLYQHNFHEFTHQKGGLEKSLLQINSLFSELSAQLASNETAYQTLQKELEEANPGLKSLSEKITVCREQLAIQETSLLNIQDLMDNGAEKQEGYELELKEALEELLTAQEDSQKVQTTLSHNEKKVKELADQFATIEEQKELSEEEVAIFTRTLEDLKEESLRNNRLLDQNAIHLESAKKEFSELSKRKGGISQALSGAEKKFSEASILLESLRAKSSAHERSSRERMDARTALQKEKDGNEQQLSLVRNEREELLEQHTRLTATLVSTQEILGKEQNPRAVLEAAGAKVEGWFLPDCLEFKSGYDDVSPEAQQAFSHWAERLLLKNRNDLECLIPHQQRLQQDLSVTFLDASVSKKSAKNLKATSFSTLLSIKQKAPETAISSLLERMFYIEGSLPAANQPTDGEIWFTSRGEVYTQADSVHLSGTHRSSTLLYAKKIEKLEKELEPLSKKLEKLEKRKSELQEQQVSLQKDIQEVEGEIYEKNRISLDLAGDLKACEIEMRHKKELITSSREQNQALLEKYQLVEDLLEELTQKKEILLEEKTEIKDELDKTLERSGYLEDTKEELAQQKERLQLDLATEKTKTSGLRERFELLLRQQSSLEEKYKKRKTSLDTFLTEAKQAATNKKKFEDKIQQLLAEREMLEAELDKHQHTNAELLQALKKNEADTKKLRDTHLEVQKKKGETQLDIERAELAISEIDKQTQEKYQIEIKTAPYEEREGFSATATQKLIQKTKERLDKMGDINMLAIKEHEELSERHSFIHGQRNDITSSLEVLQDAIAEIEETSLTRFMETFVVLNQEFSLLFPILFPGGEAQIQLVEPEQPLHTGVEILVRLPGKKRQNMLLFSGGEKALTAIALIFALLKSKPTPFCFLDEVDAPLDEANVGRFNNVLKALAPQFQFIVITHRRPTIEALDMLYGVTMQEPGVSKLVGVDMQQALPPHLQKTLFASDRKGASAFD